jgi:hypothetical protein
MIHELFFILVCIISKSSASCSILQLLPAGNHELAWFVNFLHLFHASNAYDVVPASVDLMNGVFADSASQEISLSMG